MKIKTTILFGTFLLSIQFCFSQESEKNFSVDVSADIVSRYVWRGINLSESPSIQPNLAFSYKSLSFGSWASYSFAREPYQEVDLFLTYETEHLKFTVNDYYNPIDSIGFSGDYFHMKSKSTRHILEGMVTMNGSESFPISLTAGIMFYGYDKGDDGKNQYSTYIELSYAATIQDIEVTPFIGLTPAKGYYGENLNVVNLGITAVKNIEISDKCKLPLKSSFIINPEQEKVYFVIGVTF